MKAKADSIGQAGQARNHLINMVKISVITTVLNGADTIRGCIKSIQSQTVPVKHIIIDGGSSDRTLEIIEEYKSDTALVVSEPDNGIYDAMNKGLRFVAGDVVGILNADDFYADSTVLEKVAYAFADKKVDACYGDLIYIDSKNTDKVFRYWRAGEFKPEKFYWGWMPPHPTFFVRRDIYEKYGLFNLGLGSAADYELMLRLLLKNRISVAYIPEILVKMRVGGASNASLRKRIKANKMDRRAWEINGLKPYPWTLWMKPLRKIPQWWQRE